MWILYFGKTYTHTFFYSDTIAFLVQEATHLSDIAFTFYGIPKIIFHCIMYKYTPIYNTMKYIHMHTYSIELDSIRNA